MTTLDKHRAKAGLSGESGFPFLHGGFPFDRRPIRAGLPARLWSARAAPFLAMFKPSVIRALLTRYVLLYAKNPMRAFELFFWPLVQLLVWGFVTMFLQKQGGGGAFPQYITFLIGGIILWDSLFRAQQGVSISFLEDVWTRNLLNIFAAPVRMPCFF